LSASTSDSVAPPLFIVSCSRSGSTLLRYIIDTHPEICCPGELRLGNLCTLLMNLVDSLSLGQVAVASSRKKERDPLVMSEVNAMVRGWLDAYAQARGKRYWCEKDPSNSRYLNLLSQVFPDARFICLYRNCMDVVHSLLEIVRTSAGDGQVYDGDEVGGYVDRWLETNARIVEFQHTLPDRCLSVRYEDVVIDSRATLSRVFDFIGVPWQPALLDRVFATDHGRGFGDPKIPFASEIHRDSIGKGASISMRTVSAASLNGVNRLLDQLGYARLAADHRPAPALASALGKTAQTHEQHDIHAQLRNLFENVVPHRLRSKPLPVARAGASICRFIVAGDDNGAWTIDLERQLVARVNPVGDADCTIRIESSDLLDIAHGNLNPGQAYILRRAHIEGDLGIATHVWHFVHACLGSADQRI
jgi:protein-tyrosine sulfotransferase